MENVITLGKLIGLLLLFCPPFLSILLLKIQGMSSLAHPVTGMIFLVNFVWPKYAVHAGREMRAWYQSFGHA